LALCMVLPLDNEEGEDQGSLEIWILGNST